MSLEETVRYDCYTRADVEKKDFLGFGVNGRLHIARLSRVGISVYQPGNTILRLSYPMSSKSHGLDDGILQLGQVARLLLV